MQNHINEFSSHIRMSSRYGYHSYQDICGHQRHVPATSSGSAELDCSERDICVDCHMNNLSEPGLEWNLETLPTINISSLPITPRITTSIPTTIDRDSTFDGQLFSQARSGDEPSEKSTSIASAKNKPNKYRCQLGRCTFKTDRSDTFDRHLLTVKHGVRQFYPCWSCQKRFSRPDSVTAHVKRGRCKASALVSL